MVKLEQSCIEMVCSGLLYKVMETGKQLEILNALYDKSSKQENNWKLWMLCIISHGNRKTTGNSGCFQYDCANSVAEHNVIYHR